MASTEQLAVYRNCVPVVDDEVRRSEERTVGTAVVEAVARAEGVDSAELDPLYDVVDVEALERLIEHHDGTTGADAMYSFTYGTWNVFVRADGRIRVCDATRSVDPTPVFGEAV